MKSEMLRSDAVGVFCAVGYALVCLLVVLLLAAAVPARAHAAGELGSTDYIGSVDFGNGTYSTAEDFVVRISLKSVPSGQTVHFFDAKAKEALGSTTVKTADIAVQADRSYRIVATLLESLEGVSDEELAEFSASCGHDAMVDTARLSHRLYTNQYCIEEVGVGLNQGYAHSQLSTESRVTVPDAAATGLGHLYERTAYRDPVTGAELTAKSAGKTTLNGMEATVWSVVCTGLRPNTSYKTGLYTVYRIGGRELASGVEGFSVATDPLEAPSVSAVKISAKKVRISVGVPESMRVAGAYSIDLFAGTKKVKTFAVTRAAICAYVYPKSGAAKQAYKAVLRWNRDSTVAVSSAARKPVANKKSFSFSTSPASYATGECIWRPLKVSYTSKSKLRVKCVWVNNQVVLGKAKSGFKVKVTFKCQGKKIATQAFASKKTRRMTSTKQTLTFKKAKAGYDLLNGGLTWTAKVVKTF